MRLAACWRYESSLSASTPQRRLGVFSSCSRVKNQREEAPRPDAMTLPPPPAPSPTPPPFPARGLPAKAARPRPTPLAVDHAPPLVTPSSARARARGAALPVRSSLLLSF
ncbi:actin cytoskeleton-regulatory complex protein pan1-like [Sus scrofa]|uniref:actin cytoskeleton-regulatory complex protein pan1-like n=1 Tax=Sus scrofa TaxID=9823 RepID=UPI000A2B7895|nr:actin cytoskeleton-regulatory complex protein pan1-like [Sus scrofa]XP_020931008.1 actin cytoskeleton-regulatory complex protein pan1-like [Sus scrofa]